MIRHGEFVWLPRVTEQNAAEAKQVSDSSDTPTPDPRLTFKTASTIR